MMDEIKMEVLRAKFEERAKDAAPEGDSEAGENWHGVIEEIADALEAGQNLNLISQFTALCEEFDRRAALVEIERGAPIQQQAKAEQGDDDWEKDATAAGLIVNGLAVSGARLNAFFNGHRAGYARAQSAVATPSSVTSAPLYDIGMLKEQAEAWTAVVDVLQECAPDWQSHEGKATGIQLATAAIRKLASKPASTAQVGEMADEEIDAACDEIYLSHYPKQRDFERAIARAILAKRAERSGV